MPLPPSAIDEAWLVYLLVLPPDSGQPRSPMCSAHLGFLPEGLESNLPARAEFPTVRYPSQQALAALALQLPAASCILARLLAEDKSAYS